MLKETLINEPITASIVVDCSDRGEHPNAERSEFTRISEGLGLICDPRRNHVFILYGRAHRVVRSRPRHPSKGTFWRPASDGAEKRKSCSRSWRNPPSGYQLVRAAAGASGWLNCTFSPTTILAGNNVHPATIANPKTGEIWFLGVGDKKRPATSPPGAISFRPRDLRKPGDGNQRFV